jgi:hypothetical protein
VDIKRNVQEWWTRALLGEQVSAHPVFGDRIHVKVDGAVAVLTGEVETADRAEELEREVRAVGQLETVVNHLKVVGPEEDYHLQTVIAIFPDKEKAELACQTVASWKIHEDEDPEVLASVEVAEPYLREHVRAARVPRDRAERFLQAVRDGKALLVDRVPEDDALRVVSALEGSEAESVMTLPPEPASPGSF